MFISLFFPILTGGLVGGGYSTDTYYWMFGFFLHIRNDGLITSHWIYEHVGYMSFISQFTAIFSTISVFISSIASVIIGLKINKESTPRKNTALVIMINSIALLALNFYLGGFLGPSVGFLFLFIGTILMIIEFITSRQMTIFNHR